MVFEKEINTMYCHAKSLINILKITFKFKPSLSEIPITEVLNYTKNIE